MAIAPKRESALISQLRKKPISAKKTATDPTGGKDKR
jgi:hypothetical protein